MGAIVLAPGEAVQFVHFIPIGRKDAFVTSMGIQDIKDEIPVKRLMIKKNFLVKGETFVIDGVVPHG